MVEIAEAPRATSQIDISRQVAEGVEFNLTLEDGAHVRLKPPHEDNRFGAQVYYSPKDQPDQNILLGNLALDTNLPAQEVPEGRENDPLYAPPPRANLVTRPENNQSQLWRLTFARGEDAVNAHNMDIPFDVLTGEFHVQEVEEIQSVSEETADLPPSQPTAAHRVSPIPSQITTAIRGLAKEKELDYPPKLTITNTGYEGLNLDQHDISGTEFLTDFVGEGMKIVGYQIVGGGQEVIFAGKNGKEGTIKVIRAAYGAPQQLDGTVVAYEYTTPEGADQKDEYLDITTPNGQKIHITRFPDNTFTTAYASQFGKLEPNKAYYLLPNGSLSEEPQDSATTVIKVMVSEDQFKTPHSFLIIADLGKTEGGTQVEVPPNSSLVEPLEEDWDQEDAS